MKQFVNIIIAFAFLFNQISLHNQTNQNREPLSNITPTSTPTITPIAEQPAATTSYFDAYPAPTGPTETPTPEPTVPPTLAPTVAAPPDTAFIVVPEVKSLQLELSAEPALYTPGKSIQLDWAIDDASQLPSIEKASLVLHLPEGVAPHDKTLDSAITEEKTMVLPLAETDHALLWDISPDITVPFTIAVDLVLDGAVIDSNAVLFDQAISTVARGNSSVIDLPSGAVSLNIPDGSMDEALAFGIRKPSPNKLPPVSLTGKPVEIIAVATESGKNVTQFLQPIELTIRYDKELIVGGSEADLHLYYYNETDSQWHPLETTVDTANQVLTAKTDHLTVFDYQASSWQGYIPPTVDAFQVSEFTGAGTYAIDFPLLPGPAGLKPALNLTYNSQVIDEGSAFTQASWVGMGWALDTGAITRNMHETNNETNDDSFSISVGGIHGLLLPSGINGAITTYSTADQSYVKVEQDTQANTWKAWAKDGTVYQFGYAAKTSTNSCAENASDLNLTWQWALTTITDIHGNTLNYSYTPDKKPDPCLNIVAIYPDTIRYANDNYQVKFITELRGDFYSNWTERPSKTLYSTRRLKELQLQNKNDAGNWVTVRKYAFTYASDTETANVILPNFKWNDNSHTSTLIGVQEQSGDGSASLPATSFYYNADNMHLNKVDNGQGGVVEFAYERVSVFDDANKTRFKIWLFGDTDCNPYSLNGTSWTATSISVDCLYTSNPAAGYLYLYGANSMATQSFPQHIVKPGADYRFAISGMSNDPVMGTGTHWGFKNESSGDLIKLETPPDSQIILNPGPEWTPKEGTLTMPATFDPGKTVLWLANSGSKIQNLQVSQYVTRYRVTSRTVTDAITGKTAIYPYSYDNFAYNHAAAGENLYTKVMGEFRGHSLAQVTDPAGLTTMTWFHQGNDLKGSPYRALNLKQTYGIDGFVSIQANAWTSSPANSSIVDYLYGSDFDTSVNTKNDSANWNVTFSRSSANLTDGMAAIAHVRLSEVNSQGQVGLVSASGRFFGVLLTPQGGIQQCVDGCSGAQIGNTLVSPADFQPGAWYVVILQVDDDDELRVRIWPLDRPELYSEAAAGGFSSESWRFIQMAYNGKLWLDAYSEGFLYSEIDTAYAVDMQAQMVSGNDAVNNRWPYSMVGGQPQAFTDLYIRWARPVQTSTRTYGGDASQNQGDSRWIGTRQTFDYAPKEQFGNLIHTTDYRWGGSNWAADHARGVAYFPRDDGTRYLVSLPARVIEVACNPDCDFSGANGLLAETLYLYDTNSVYNAPPNGAGRLAKQRTLVDELLGQKRYSETAYSYADSYGNITGVTTYTGFATENSSSAGVGRTTERIYDDKYHAYLATETNALHQTTTTGYDFNLGLPTRLTDANGALQGAAYDAFARLTAVCAPGDWDGITCDPDSSPTLSIRYTNYNGQANPKQPFNVLLQQKLDDTRTMQSQRYYSGWGELLQSQVLGVLLAEGTRNTVVDYQYDALSRLVRQTQPYAYAGSAAFQAQPLTAAQGTATTTYDILSRVIRITQADGSAQASAYTLAYDLELGWGLQTALTDARGQTTLRLQDAWGRQVRVTPPAGPGVKYAYDALGRLTDAYYGSAHTGLTYNYAGQKISMADADMGSWSYAYDAPGNLQTQTDARHQRTCLYYDELNRLTGKNYQSDAAPCPGGVTSGFTVSYNYDDPVAGAGIGRRTGMSDPGGGAAWVYDLRGRVEQEVVSISGVGEYVTTWTYNSADLVTGMVYPNGEVVTTDYTPQGTVSTVNSSLWDSYVVQTGYDAAGRMLERRLGNDGKTAYTYYPWTAQGGRLQNVSSSKLSAPLTPWQDLDYTYDANGNLGSITDAVSPETLAFGYDAINRLTGVSGAYAQSYSYDPLTGNLASKAGQALAYGDPNHKHAATGMGGNAYSYDANGNMTSRTVGGVSYALGYDAENRLVSISGGGLSASYGYNGDGQRVKAEVTVGGVTETTAYVGDYFEVSVGAPRQVTVPTPPDCGGVVQCVFLPVIITAMAPIPAGHAWTSTYFAGGSRIAQRVQSNQEGVESGLYYFLTDHLGSTSVTLDASGNKVAEMRYSAWGETRFSSGETPTQRRYTGQLAAEVGLYFYNARYYDPQLGRFISADTVVPEAVQGVQAWDRYAYTNNNPVRYTDPTGHCVGPLLAVCIAVGTFIADNAAIITSITVLGAVTSFIGPSNPDPVLINNPVASQQALENSALQAGMWLTGGQAALEFGYMMRGPSLANNSADDTLSDNITVGRWMSQAEYSKMENTKMVQEGAGGTTYILYPASPNSYAKQAAPGSVYAEFDVPASSVQMTSSQLGWGRINGPNSLMAKMNEKLGLPTPQLPGVHNLRIITSKPQ